MATASEIVSKLVARQQQLERELKAKDRQIAELEANSDARFRQIESTLFYLMTLRMDDVRSAAMAQGGSQEAMAQGTQHIQELLELQKVVSPEDFATMYNVNPITEQRFASDEERDEFLKAAQQGSPTHES